MSQSQVFEWTKRFYEQARNANDQERLRLAQFGPRIIQANRENPQQALALIDEAERLAFVLKEHCWYPILSWLRGEVYVHTLLDMPTSIRVLSEAIVRMSQPVYRGCVGIQNVYIVLLTAYIYTDPFGYAEKISKALDFLENSFENDQLEQHMIAVRRTLVELGRENYDAAQKYALDSLRISANESLLLAESYTMLAETAHHRHDLQAALEYAQAGEVLLRDVEHRKMEYIQLLGYEAVYTLKLGNESAADALYQRMLLLVNELGSEPYYTFYECQAAYHEIKGEVSAAIDACQQIIEGAKRIGSIYADCVGHLHLSRLFGKAGLPTVDAIANARVSFEQLIDPSPLIKKLEQIEGGDFSADFWS